MPASQIAILGAFAGLTIFLGLPLGRMRAEMPRAKAFLNALAIGILIFLLWDVLTAAWEPADEALGGHHYATAVTYGGVMLVCVGAGLIGLVYFDRWMKHRAARLRPEGPGAATAQPALVTAGRMPPVPGPPGCRCSSRSASGCTTSARAWPSAPPPRRASSASRCCWSSGSARTTRRRASASWRRWRRPVSGRPGGALRCSGLIGGGPTFVGTIVGMQVTAPLLAIAFLALAAGSILYVVIELLAVARATRLKELVAWGIMLGLVLGFVTDAIVSAAGA